MSHVPAPEDATPPVKRRRGRQPRPSLLSPSVKAAVARFAGAVGQPKVIEPAGFRDFRGWLAYIGGPNAVHDWAPLVEAVVQDCDSDTRIIHRIKPDLVREIVKAVVIPREGESSKLVSTNCGRQCARPSSGVTLMTILDRVFANLKQWRDIAVTARNSTAYHQTSQREAQSSRFERGGPSSSSRRAPPPTQYGYESVLPPVDRILPERRPRNGLAHPPPSSVQHSWDGSQTGMRVHSGRAHTSLPSFQELEDSLQSRAHLGKRGRH